MSTLNSPLYNEAKIDSSSPTFKIALGYSFWAFPKIRGAPLGETMVRIVIFWSL